LKNYLMQLPTTFSFLKMKNVIQVYNAELKSANRLILLSEALVILLKPALVCNCHVFSFGKPIALNFLLFTILDRLDMTRVLVSSAAHVLSDYLLTSEGNHCYQLFKHLARYGYQFEALSPYIRVRKPLDNVAFHQVGSFKMSPTSGVMQKCALHSEFLFRGLIKAKKLLDEMKPDIVHHMLPAVFNYTFSPLALLAKNLKQPFVFGPISAHFYERPVDEKVLLPFTSRLHRATIQKCDRLITVTNQIKSFYETLIDPQLISVIPLGVDTETFKPAAKEEEKESFEILYAGSLYSLKGLPYLIQAIASLRKVGLKTSLTIIGEGQQKQALITLAKTLSVEKDVKFEGFVPHSEMPKYYKRCDVFCFPSLGEPFGMAVVEAMACGKTVIATNVGGPSEIIHDEIDGILVPPADPQAIASQIMRLAQNESERRKMGEKARRKAVQSFSWTTIAEKYHQLYSKLL